MYLMLSNLSLAACLRSSAGQQSDVGAFPRIAFVDSTKYGTDKPDLRNPIEMTDVTETFRSGLFLPV